MSVIIYAVDVTVLKSGITIACFQALEKIPVAREVLIMHAMYEIMTGRASLRNRYCMPSEPSSFVCLSLLIVCLSVSVSPGSAL